MLWHKVQGAGGVGGAAGNFDIQAGAPIFESSGITTFSVAYPSDIVAGDLLFICGQVFDNINASATGFTQNTNINGPQLLKTATGSESGSITVTFASATTEFLIAAMYRIRSPEGTPTVGYFSADGSSPHSIVLESPRTFFPLADTTYTVAGHMLVYHTYFAFGTPITVSSPSVTISEFLNATIGQGAISSNLVETELEGALDTTYTSTSSPGSRAIAYEIYVP